MFFGIDLIQAIQVIGYPGIFAIILAESGLFFAVSLPGGSLLFTAGLLASQGYLNIWILSAIVLVAATLGDSIGYWFGAWVGPALWRRPDSRFFKRKHLEQTREFFDEHGSKAILIGRFIPIIRTFVPILAGVAKMNYSTFLAYNVFGAIIWGGGFTLAGFFLGAAIPNMKEYIEIIVLAIVFVTILPLIHQVWRAHRNGKKKAQVLDVSLPQAVIFDLDDTLTESFTPPSMQVLEKLFTLAEKVPVAIMSGGSFVRIERDVMKRAPHTADASRFFVLSDNGARCDVWNGNDWDVAYNFPLTENDRGIMRKAIEEAVVETQIFEPGEQTYRIVDRGTSVAFAALEDGATKTKKSAWDPDFVKRPKLAEVLRKKLPGYQVLIGGKTTIDIVTKGISKAYGVEWLAKELNLLPEEMLFVGDAFYAGGNDAVVIPTGIRTHATSGPDETEGLIDGMLNA